MSNKIIVEVFRVDTYDGKRIGKVLCPNCKKKHTHGLGKVTEPIESFLSHKLSHCFKKNVIGYYLTLKEGVQVPS